MMLPKSCPWVGIEHDVALRGHPLELMEEDVAVRRVGAAMDVEDQRILLARRKTDRLQDTRLDSLAIEAGIPEVLGLRELELGEERVVHVGERHETLGRGVEGVQIGQVRRVADRE